MILVIFGLCIISGLTVSKALRII